MTEPVVPVRAWAEYPEWSVFCDTEAPTWLRYGIPKGEHNRLSERRGDTSLVDTLTGLPYGPLQSLHVLLSNGAELHIDPKRYGEPDPMVAWHWVVGQGGKVVASGFYYEDNDAEAVQRALTAAAAYFNPTRTPS